MGNYQIFFYFGSKTSESPLEVHIFKKNPRDKKFKNCNLKKYVFFDIYIILGKNQIWKKKSF